MHNIGVALELIINQTNTSITTIKSSSAKLIGVRAAWHQRTSWAQPPGTGTAISAKACQPCKSMISAGKHHVSSLSFWLFSCLSRFFVLALSCGALLCLFLYNFCWQVLCQNHVRVNEFLNMSQNFVDHCMPLQLLVNHNWYHTMILFCCVVMRKSVIGICTNMIRYHSTLLFIKPHLFYLFH